MDGRLDLFKHGVCHDIGAVMGWDWMYGDPEWSCDGEWVGYNPRVHALNINHIVMCASFISHFFLP